MFFHKKRRGASEPKARSSPAPGGGLKSSQTPAPKMSVRDISVSDPKARRQFPGPRQAEAALRVAVERSAYAELIAHAKESLEAEVCGVLAGQVCEDDAGVFVHVEAVIRGTAASQASTHVTFTQATWNAIHSTLERDYPKLRMVGWYHTHPGFGVEFSDMDLFIQENFFPGPTQIALVTDPLSGAVAICVNTPRGIEYLARFWVDGREQLCRLPERASVKPGPVTGEAAPRSDETQTLQVLEARISQLIQAVDEERTLHHQFLMFVGAVFCLAIVAAVGYTIYSQMISRLEPLKLDQIVPVPVLIGDKEVLLGVGVTEWHVPPELDALLVKREQLKLEAAAKAAKEAEKKARRKPGDSATATNAPAKSTPDPSNERK